MSDNTGARCDWSDLPTDQCNHCHPERRLSHLERGEPARPRVRVVHPVALQTATGPNEIPSARLIATDDPKTVHEYVVALTQATVHHQPYTVQQRNPDGTHTLVTQRHRTTSPSLLEQLASATEPLAGDGDGVRAFASKPSARVDTIDAYLDIEREVLAWLRRLDLPIPDHHDLATELQRAAANADERDIKRDVRSWWIRARTVTGWDSPAWRPRNTCPLCATSGSLRVRLDAQTAVCVSCWEGWDSSTIGLLADHIRRENDDLGETVSDVG
ncbi:hypothetical protein [Aeromicrobium phragmitis]|uniref:hypothetical protein n=1 Tax=Aeromicrobium phragmitis TaxID=2478914 RepID=UPI00140966F9|nr:hypothetical protein [Aeromicrobium phragmitis]